MTTVPKAWVAEPAGGHGTQARGEPRRPWCTALVFQGPQPPGGWAPLSHGSARFKLGGSGDLWGDNEVLGAWNFRQAYLGEAAAAHPEL